MATCLLLTQMLIVSADAATITIASTTIAPSTTYPTSPSATATLRIYSSITFTASDGTVVMAGTPGSGAFFKSVTCTITGGVITIPAFTLLSTTDAVDNSNARYTAIFFDSKGVKRDTYLADFPLPISLGSTITWGQIRVYKAGTQPWHDTSVYTKTQTDAQIQAAIGSTNDAGAYPAGPKGRVYLSSPATVANEPIAVGANDPRVAPDGTWYYALNYTSLDDAIIQLGDTVRVTLVISEPMSCTNPVVPPTMTLKFVGNGRMVPDAGFVPNIRGNIDAPKAMWIFDCSASGTGISFEDSVAKGDIYPQWFGAVVGDGIDDFAALTAMVAAASTGARSIHFLDGTYDISNTLKIAAFTGFHIYGENKASTRLVINTANKSAIFMNHGSYGVMERLQITTTAASTNVYALLDIDADGSLGALKTQQISLRDLFITGGQLAANCLRISQSGASSQGDTIWVGNLLISQCLDAGIKLGGQNALGVLVEDSDIQACYHWGVYNSGGQIFLNGTSFQNQDLGLVSDDGIPISQITTGGADYFSDATGGTSGISSMTDIRSESDILVSGGSIHIRHAAVNAGSSDPYFPNSFYSPGQMIRGTVGVGQKGELGRTFMLVESGGTKNFATPEGNSTLTVINDLSQSWTVNQWAGFYLGLRYPNGFIGSAQIASNTATSITLATPLPYNYWSDAGHTSVCGFPGQRFNCSQYRIGGLTSGTEPTWSSVPKGWYNQYSNDGGSNGFVAVAGSNVISGWYYAFGISPSVGDYVLIHRAGTNGGPFISHITNIVRPNGSGGVTVTLADNAITSTPNGESGYVGTPVTDGQVKWMSIDYVSVSTGGTVVDLYSNGGKLASAASLTDSYFSRPDFLGDQFNAGNPITALRWMKNVAYSASGEYNSGPAVYVPDFVRPGDDVASANTIAPTGASFTLTGNGTVKTITPNNFPPGTTLYIKCSGTPTFDETGNMLINGAATTLTATAGDIVIAYWNGTVWQVR